jgi:hypothetical protein
MDAVAGSGKLVTPNPNSGLVVAPPPARCVYVTDIAAVALSAANPNQSPGPTYTPGEIVISAYPTAGHATEPDVDTREPGTAVVFEPVFRYTATQTFPDEAVIHIPIFVADSATPLVTRPYTALLDPGGPLVPPATRVDAAIPSHGASSAVHNAIAIGLRSCQQTVTGHGSIAPNGCQSVFRTFPLPVVKRVQPIFPLLAGFALIATSPLIQLPLEGIA